MINIKLHKNEIEYIKMGVESNAWFGNDEKLAERILKKLDKALTIPVVVGQSEQLICEHCNKYKRTQGNGVIHKLCECGE